MDKFNENRTNKLINGSLWFKHPNDFSNRKEMLELRMRLGFEALGIYWAFVEYLANDRENRNRFCDTDKEYRIASISIGKITPKRLSKAIKECISLKLFKERIDEITRKRFFFSEFVEESIKNRKQKSDAGKNGMLVRYDKMDIPA